MPCLSGSKRCSDVNFCSFHKPNTFNQAATEFLGGVLFLPARVHRPVDPVKQDKRSYSLLYICKFSLNEGSSTSSIWKMNSGQGVLAGGGQRLTGHRIPQSWSDRLSVGVYTPWYNSVILSKLVPFQDDQFQIATTTWWRRSNLARTGWTRVVKRLNLPRFQARVTERLCRWKWQTVKRSDSCACHQAPFLHGLEANHC